MCGIVGLYNFDRTLQVDTRLVEKMCDRIRHRGPDDVGTFVEESVALGMRRLSIIDLGSGRQPIFNERRNLVIVFNGEIYNYRELRSDLERRGHLFSTKSDTETILHAYEEYGPGCTSRLNGMFAFAIFDREAWSLFVARDHIGIKPLYYHVGPRGLVVGSEIKSLLLHPDVPRQVDEEALIEYMNYGYVTGDHTLFRGVQKLPAGHSMTVNGSAITVTHYWNLPQSDSEPDRGEEHYRSQVYEALRLAVKRQMVSDVPLGAFLSGGLDSSSIVHLMREFTNGAVNTYSIGFGKEYAFHDELSDAKCVAEFAATNHHEIIAEPKIVDLLPRLVWHLDEPVADSSYIVTYLVSRLAAQSVKVILSGVGGDEVFGGYRRYLGFRLNRYVRFLPASIALGTDRLLARFPTSRDTSLSNLNRFGRALFRSLRWKDLDRYRSLLVSHEQGVLAKARSEPDSLSPTFAMGIFSEEMNGSNLLHRMQCYDMRHSLVDDLLLLTDKMTMACSLESRVPLLDVELVELLASVPPQYKIKGLNLRVIQKSIMKGHLPDSVLRKKKKGFGCPIGAWVRNELREYIMDCLSPARLARHGLFNAGVVDRVIQDHYARRADYTDLLMSLLTFEIWYDTFVDSPVS